MSKTSLVQAFSQTQVKLEGGKEQCGVSGGDPISKLIELFFMQITTTFVFIGWAWSCLDHKTKFIY